MFSSNFILFRAHDVCIPQNSKKKIFLLVVLWKTCDWLVVKCSKEPEILDIFIAGELWMKKCKKYESRTWYKLFLTLTVDFVWRRLCTKIIFFDGDIFFLCYLVTLLHFSHMYLSSISGGDGLISLFFVVCVCWSGLRIVAIAYIQKVWGDCLIS